MDSQERDPLFDPLRRAIDAMDTPRGVEKELLQAFAKQFPRKRRWYRALTARAWAVTGALATAGMACALLVANLAPQTRDAGGAGPHVARGDDGGVFIALDSIERIEREPAPRMVATEVSRTSLAALGLPLTPENAGDSVRAEMLVAADGQPLALRLSSTN
jgi:hypothetical protein